MRGGRRAVNATPILLEEDLPSKCAWNITNTYVCSNKKQNLRLSHEEAHSKRKRNRRKMGWRENCKYFHLYFHLYHTWISDKGDVKVFLRLMLCL